MPRARFFWDSIRWRAALLTSALVAVVLTAFIWYAVARVEADLIQSGGDRAAAAATVLAAQTAQTTQQSLTRVGEVARDGAVRAFLLSPDERTKDAAIASLHRAVGRTQEQTIVLWDTNGHRVLETAFPPEAATLMPRDSAPTAAGLTPLQVSGDVLFTRTVADVPGDRAQGQPARLGFLVTSHVIRAAPSSAVLSGIVGNGATVLVGNQSGKVWTDLARIVPAPEIDVTRTVGHEFRAASGESQIGASAIIPGTPWVLVVAFPRRAIVAPAWQLLKRFAAIGVVLMLVTMFVAGALSSRVTKPLDELNLAAQALARGDYSRRVVASRRDEVGQLGSAFNAMAEQIHKGRVALEARAEELVASHEIAREANDAKDRFLAILSHELRTPLSAILGWCQMLREGTVPADRVAHALRVIERNAVAQRRLVEDLLDVSRIVAGKFAVEMGTADPVAIVQAAIESIQPVADAKSIVLSIGVGRETGADGGVLHGDPGRLQQAVWNLLSNAIKFTPHGGSVYVSVGHVGSSVEIVVRDTGDGISRDALPRVFERLQQGEGGTARRHAGLGLGLAIVRQVVDLHHGTVSAESDGPGQGATFRIVLPTSIVTAPRERPAIEPRSSVSSDGFADAHASVRGVRVLLVEDAADARELLNHVLARHGAVVTSVPNAEAAVRSLKGNRPDVIISDIAMPGQDGLEMMRTIRSQPALASRFIPAIALSAYGAPEDRKQSLASGFQAHLSKPTDLADLLMTVASLVASGSQQGPRAGTS